MSLLHHRAANVDGVDRTTMVANYFALFQEAKVVASTLLHVKYTRRISSQPLRRSQHTEAIDH